MLSSKQFYIMLIIGVISMKMQKLPGLVYGELGKDGYLLFLIYMLVNILLIILVFFIIKRINFDSILKQRKSVLAEGVRKILFIVASVYFLSQALLLYEHIQGLFANTLFDNLSWALFSLLLLFAVFFLAFKGIENIALNYEIYLWVILGSCLAISILGVGYTDLSVVFPFETINLLQIFKQLPSFGFWFGDAILVLILGAKTKEIKLSKTLICYIFTMCFVSFLVIEFYGMYSSYASVQPGLIGVLSSQALLGLNIGRVDWFLILFAELGAILTCAVYLYYSNLCAETAFSRAKPTILKVVVILLLYVVDVFYFVDMSAKINFFHGDISWISAALQGLIILVLLFIGLVNYRHKNNKNDLLKRRLKS